MVILRNLIIGFLIVSIVACTDKEQGKQEKAETKAQHETHESETSSEVPELWAFHDVIYQIWHKAWPEKNTNMLKDLIPEIETGFAKLEKASLPGILRDKKESWTKGIQDMAGIIETYKKTAAADQKESLLKAAEDLHTQFEMLVRLVRPVMKEIDHFHQELYMIYHYYMPEYNLEKIDASAAELLLRMEPIEKAKLPSRLTDKQSVFDQAKIGLRESIIQLQNNINGEAEKDQVVKAIEVVHDKYQTLVGVFE
jgi:hypothetical protein